MSEEKNNELITALVKAQKDFKHARKEVDNNFYKSKYADLAAVIDAAKIPLVENGLTVTQTTKFIDNTVILVTTLWHVSGRHITSEFPVLPVKNDPQSYGSALTYARRYSYAAILCLASDDDDGEVASNESSNDIAVVFEAIGSADSIESLTDIYREMHEKYPSIRAQIKTAASKRKAYLEGLKNASA